MRWLAAVLDRPFRFLVRLIFTPILLGWMIGAVAFGAMLGALAGFFLSIPFFDIPPGQSAWEMVIYIPCMIGVAFVEPAADAHFADLQIPGKWFAAGMAESR